METTEIKKNVRRRCGRCGRQERPALPTLSDREFVCKSCRYELALIKEVIAISYKVKDILKSELASDVYRIWSRRQMENHYFCVETPKKKILCLRVSTYVSPKNGYGGGLYVGEGEIPRGLPDVRINPLADYPEGYQEEDFPLHEWRAAVDAFLKLVKAVET